MSKPNYLATDLNTQYVTVFFLCELIIRTLIEESDCFDILVSIQDFL